MLAYLLTSKTTGRSYVGITSKKLNLRVNQHRADFKRGKKTPLYNAMRKYGFDDFALSVIYEAADWRELCAFEKGAIAERGTFYPGGYNLTCGGEGALGVPMKPHVKAALRAALTGKPKIISAETRARISAAHKGRKHGPMSAEHRAAIGARNKGHVHTAEAKAKIGAASRGNTHCRGRKLSPEHRAKILAHLTGRKVSDETRAKLSASNKGKKRSPEVVAKMSASKIGVKHGPHSAERRAKIAAANRGIKKPGWTTERRVHMKALAEQRRIKNTEASTCQPQQ
jgi:group I intron endonuclease